MFDLPDLDDYDLVSSLHDGDTVCVVFQESDEDSGASHGGFTPAADWHDAGRRLHHRSGLAKRHLVQISHGIEKYLVPEGTGEGFPFRKEPAARVVVDDAGNAVLRQPDETAGFHEELAVHVDSAIRRDHVDVRRAAPGSTCEVPIRVTER